MPEHGVFTFTVLQDQGGQRLDLFLYGRGLGLSRTTIQRLIANEKASVNGQNLKPGHSLHAGDTVVLDVPEPVKPRIEPEKIPLDVLFEDDVLLVINKPAGLIVHPAHDVTSGTLVNALLHHCRGNLSGINGVLRPGIVHRLDKETTGALVAAKKDWVHEALSDQLQKRLMRRRYVAVVLGEVPRETGVVDAPIGRDPVDRTKMAVTILNARRAVTYFKVRERFAGYTLLDCELDTGRTHQIRVHLAYTGYPVVGDTVYGFRRQRIKLAGHALHAYNLSFVHPVSSQPVSFDAPLPADLELFIESLRSGRVPEPV